MKQNIEIEFKNLLTKEEFHSLCQHYNIHPSQFKTQINHYFETPQFHLKESGCALRIREKHESFTMTLKEPLKEGLLETDLPLPMKLAEEVIANKQPIPERMALYLQKKNVPIENLHCVGSLITHRHQWHVPEGLLVLDHSEYNGVEDYELEFECTDFERGKQFFENLLQTLQIKKKVTDNKIKRFFQSLL